MVNFTKDSNKRMKRISFVIMITFVVFSTEVISFLLLNSFPNLSYDKNKISQTAEEYIEKRDSVLGWDKVVNKYGNSRILPNRDYVNNKSKQIDFYGDSYTYGAEVDNDNLIWTNLISKELNIIVNNKGVGGFGSDQSYLKYIINENPSDIVVLNHLSENIIRNVNQFRHLIYPSNSYDLKPRFISESDSLKLIRIPNIDSSFIDFKNNPNKYLKHEFFSIGSESGIYPKKFPYSFTLLKSLISNWKIKSLFGYFSGYQPFYNINHKSEGLKITKLILESFVYKSKKRGVTPIVTILPTYRDFEYYGKYNYFPYQKLIEKLDSSFLIIDYGSKIIRRQDQFNLKEILNLYKTKHGHMNENGHKILSSIFSDFVKKNKLI